MGLLRTNNHKPPIWLPNGHFQTIYPALFREVDGIVYQREKIGTPDNDFLMLDWCIATPGRRGKTLVILSHGFEGDSHRSYMKGMVKAMRSLGHDCLAWNYRSCGGILNDTAQFYHSGATKDLDHVINHALQFGYEQIGLIGFSLGGNLTLKYLGENRIRPKEIVKALCFSVPMDLEACSRHLDRGVNRVYQERFLKTLRTKIKEKAVKFPELLDKGRLTLVNSVYTFDDVFTGPLHGFQNAHEYYGNSSAKAYISGIKIPTLIIHAVNDPMIPVECLPLKEIAALPNVDMLLSGRGGHCGFATYRSGEIGYWSEEEAKLFLTMGN